MYSNVIRDEEYKNRLLKFVEREYGLAAVGVAPAKRGFFGETWRLCAPAADYFLKLVYAPAHMRIYERSFPVVQRLCDHGIDFVGRIVKTVKSDLFSRFDGAALGVFDWIEGENVQTEASKIEEYKMMAKVYTVPVGNIDIASENFTAKDADEFYERWGKLDDERTLALLEKNRNKIEHRFERLNTFSEICRGDTSGFFITHGDAGGNFLVSGDSNYIVDWDSAKLAPPERDAWFCVQWDWAMSGFRDALKQNGIDYSLRAERFAYYCYWFFFYYLNAYLDARTETSIVEEYIDGWMSDNVKWADTL